MWIPRMIMIRYRNVCQIPRETEKQKKNPKNVVFNTSNVSGLKEKIIEHYSKDVKDI